MPLSSMRANGQVCAVDREKLQAVVAFSLARVSPVFFALQSFLETWPHWSNSLHPEALQDFAQILASTGGSLLFITYSLQVSDFMGNQFARRNDERSQRQYGNLQARAGWRHDCDVAQKCPHQPRRGASLLKAPTISATETPASSQIQLIVPLFQRELPGYSYTLCSHHKVFIKNY